MSRIVRRDIMPHLQVDAASVAACELTRLLETAKCCGEIGAEDIGEIAAFLNEHGRKPEPRDRSTNAPEPGRRHRKAGKRIVLRRIEAERHHERAGRERADGFFRLTHSLYVVVVAGALRQWNVQICAQARARAPFLRISPYIRIVEDGVGMDRNRENVGAFVEDALRAIAVMHVDIEDRDPLVLQLKLSRRHCTVVEKAESARKIAIGVMTWWPAQRVGRV